MASKYFCLWFDEVSRAELQVNEGLYGQIDLLTVDIEFLSPAVLALADGVAGYTAIHSFVLFPHRTDQQCGVVLGEVVSLTGSQWDVVPLPLENNSCSSGNRASPCNVCLVLNNRIRWTFLNHWHRHRD